MRHFLLRQRLLQQVQGLTATRAALQLLHPLLLCLRRCCLVQHLPLIVVQLAKKPAQKRGLLAFGGLVSYDTIMPCRSRPPGLLRSPTGYTEASRTDCLFRDASMWHSSILAIIFLFLLLVAPVRAAVDAESKTPYQLRRRSANRRPSALHRLLSPGTESANCKATSRPPSAISVKST